MFLESMKNLNNNNRKNNNNGDKNIDSKLLMGYSAYATLCFRDFIKIICISPLKFQGHYFIIEKRV